MKETIKAFFEGIGITLGVVIAIPIVLVLSFIAFNLLGQTTAGGNLIMSILENQYRVPGTSSYFSFECTRMNDGNGEWCRYGEDRTYYYSYGSFFTDGYGSFPKDSVEKCSGFDPQNHETWCKNLVQNAGYSWSPRN